MVDIMVGYHQYVPGSLDSDPVSCILYRDALSCERANDAQIARINWDQSGTDYKGLPQSTCDMGTLCYISNGYQHYNVNNKTSSCFNYATDLLRYRGLCHSKIKINDRQIPKDIETL
ncbi:hypothetical protein CHS0354_038389 [Potamilus streckersoni]|uniref:Uncharacterized protein n=1 Tax=Potamilus streckersoni TaxID=2493646 RepID=A0AAE0S5Z1_9BIVA|nr:hypothetical protein CHS0354_038389 [Potamilus streckersoni]